MSGVPSYTPGELMQNLCTAIGFEIEKSDRLTMFRCEVSGELNVVASCCNPRNEETGYVFAYDAHDSPGCVTIHGRTGIEALRDACNRVLALEKLGPPECDKCMSDEWVPPQRGTQGEPEGSPLGPRDQGGGAHQGGE